MTFPLAATLLQRLGWDDGWEAAFEPHRVEGYAPARVAVQHRGAYDLIGEDGQVRARAATRLVKADELPAVGDWVVLDVERRTVEETLPRRTALSRKEVWQVTREQVLAANVDIAFLVQALPLDVNVRRLERYLATAWESGAQPVVLLTKTDLVEDVDPWLDEVEAVTLGACPVLALSPRTGDHVEDVRPYFEGNRTAVLLGSSGVGKSTLVNVLLGEDLLPTQEVRADDQAGRHTTSHRELILLPGGGVVLDTPGMRELHLWDADLDSTFGDVEELAQDCRFTDCSHHREPGCAVRAALADGTLPRARWESYTKLQRELDAVERKRNVLARREYTRQFKIRERAQRQKRR